MKISVNWLKWYGLENPAPQGIDALVERIGAQLGAVEEVIDLGKNYQGVTVARVMSCQDHPNADRLHVCKLDDNGVTKNVERDENGYVQVVCGAPNVREGLLVAWLPPASTVPESMFAGDPFVLEARPLRGVISNGMLASPRELAIGDGHDGILEIDDDKAQPGMAFADVYELNDTIIDVENKMFTHRPDCFGQLGVAREIAGIYGQAFKSPDWYLQTLTNELTQSGETLPLAVRNELPQDVPHFMAVALSAVHIKPSPVWLQSYLARVGVKSINNVVDITNYIMLLTGQPLHAYDYDKVKAQDGVNAQTATLVVRNPQDGEKIKLLNGKEITPREQAIMIATENKLIGVGGVMGGADTEVDQNTTSIILECATFNMYSIRRTAMTHGLFTDAVTRNNKGQSPLQNERVFAKTIEMLRTLASAQVAGEVINDNHLDAAVVARDAVFAPVEVSRTFINERLGFNLSTSEMATLLTNVEFRVELTDDSIVATAPFWRTDIEIAEDIVEEVGRLYGFDHLPKVLPRRDLTPAARDLGFELRKRIRDILSSAGANEVLSYSFVHGNLLQKAGQNPAQAFQLSNAISPDLQYYRLSLTPSLLDKVHANIKSGYDEFALFEMGKSHIIGITEEDGLPKELPRVALVLAAKKKKTGAAFYEAKASLTHLLNQLGLAENVTFKMLDANEPDVATAYYAQGRAATVYINDVLIGRIGEFKSSVSKAFKLPEYSAGFELGLDPLLHIKAAQSYQQLPRFPKIEQDICLKVPSQTAYAQVADLTRTVIDQNAGENTKWSLTPVDIYQRPEELDYKQITLRLSIASFDKTMTDSEVAKMLDQVAATAAQQLQAERI